MRNRAKGVAAALMMLGVLPALAQEAEGPAELDLRDRAGAEQRLSAYRGRIVILNFWATWCVPCRAEMPMLVRIAKEYEARGVMVIGPSADAPETQEKVEPFLREAGITFPVWVGATTEHMHQLGLGTALPATAVIDRDGRIVGRILGPLEEKDLRARIEWCWRTRRSVAPRRRQWSTHSRSMPRMNTREKRGTTSTATKKASTLTRKDSTEPPPSPVDRFDRARAAP